MYSATAFLQGCLFKSSLNQTQIKRSMHDEKTLQNLKAGSNKKWQHTPTEAIRIPKVLVPQILTIARCLDAGAKRISLTRDLEDLPLEELLEIQKKLPALIEVRRKEAWDRADAMRSEGPLEKAILFLAKEYEGASTNDETGFSEVDKEFGEWLAERIKEKKAILHYHAEAALELLREYEQTHLRLVGISLPQWEAIAHQYPESLEGTIEKQSNKRIILIGDRICVYFPYDKNLVSQIKLITPKGRFEPSDKSWRFPIKAAERLVITFDFDVDDNVLGTIALLQQKRKKDNQSRLDEARQKGVELFQLIESANLDEPLPCGWNLYEHQKKAVEWLLAHRRGVLFRGGILADHMGLGKSISALKAAKTLSDNATNRLGERHIFVICPASLRENWGMEAEKVGCPIEIFSWAKLPKPLVKQQYILIGDESHYLQNLKSQRTKKFLELASSENCLAVWLLTGTPMKNGRPVNLFPLLKAIAHPLSADRQEYEAYYCQAGYKKVGRDRQIWDVSGAAHLDELAEEIENCLLRRTKQECLDLPKKQRIFKPVKLTPEQQKAYNLELSELISDYRDRVKRGEVDEGAEALVVLNYLRKTGSKYKVDEAILLVEELLEQEQQVVVFVEFLETAQLLYSSFREIAGLLTGATPGSDRQAIVDKFQAGKSKVFIGTIKAGGVGLTLTAASNVILLDRPWTPGDSEQAEDRCHRIGQHQTVFSFWIQMGIIDEAIDKLLQQKQERIDLVLKGKRKTLRGVESPKELAKQLLENL